MTTWVLVCLKWGISLYVETSLFPSQCVMHLGASNPLTVVLVGGLFGWLVAGFDELTVYPVFGVYVSGWGYAF